MAAPITLNANINLNPSSVNASARQVQQALGRITGQASEFQKSLDASTARVFAFGATTAVIQGISQSFKQLVSTTIEVQAKLVEINSILGASSAEFGKFRDSIFQAAKSTGQSFNTVASGAAELARQGLSAAETAKRLEAAMILTRISGLGAEASVKALTSAMNGFTSAGLTAEDVVNKIVAVDTRFAVSAEDLAQGFSRAGSTAEDAGVTFEELLGLITAVEQKTARGGAVIGNAFKTIFTRLSDASTIDDLKALGVQIDSSQSGVQKLQALATAIENIGDPTTVSEIKELAGGVYQINVVSAALKDLSSETSIFTAATKAAGQAGNDAYSRNAELNKSMQAQLNGLVVSLTSLAEKIGSITFAPLLENLVGVATSLSEWLDKALDPEKGNKFIQGLFDVIGKFVSGPGLVLITGAFLNIFRLVVKFAADGFKSVMQIGSASERVKSIESGIVDLLAKDANLRKVLASTTATQAQKEAAVIAAIKQQNALLVQQQQLVTNIARVAAQGGVRGYSGPSGGFSGKGGKKFATGFMQEEATAMMLGASSGVKAHYGQGKIGGSRFIMNSEEIEIPNFGRNGDSAVIPMYARGNLPRSTGGRVPQLPKDLNPDYKEMGLLSPGGTLRSVKDYESFINNPNTSDEKRRLAKKLLAEKEALEMQKEEQQIQLNAARYSYLIPKIGESGTLNPFNGSFKKGDKTIRYNMSNLKIDGPKIPQGSQELVKGSPEDEKIGENIRESIYENSAKFANRLNPIVGDVSPSMVKEKMENLGGAKGAIQAAIGSAFEGAVATSLGVLPLSNIEGGDFDIKGQSAKITSDIQKLFGLNENISIMDFKASDSSSNKDSFAKKIYNQEKKGETVISSPKLKSLPSPKRGRASGYIPRFAKGRIPRFAKGHISKPSKSPVQRFARGYAAGAIGGLLGRAASGARGLLGRGRATQAATQAATGAAQTADDAVKEIAKSQKSLGRSIAISTGLTVASAGLEKLGNDAEEAGDTVMSTYTDMAATAVQFASIGSMFGPLGTGIGAVIGAGWSLYDSMTKADQNIKEQEKANERRNKTVQGITKNLKGGGFDSIGDLRKKSAEFSSAAGLNPTGLKDEINKYYRTIIDSSSSQEEINAANEALAGIINRVSVGYANIDTINKLNLEQRKLTARLEKYQAKVAEVTNSLGTTVKNYATKSENYAFGGELTSNILSSVQGPMAASLQGQAATNQSIFATNLAQSQKFDAEQRLLENKDPEKADELKKAVAEAGENFKKSIADTAANMAKRQIEVQNRISQLQLQITQKQISLMSGVNSRIATNIKEGPLNLDEMKEGGRAYREAETDQQKGEIIAQMTEEMDRRGLTEKQKETVFSQYAGISAEERKRLEKETAFVGGTKAEREELFSQGETKQGEKEIADLKTEQAAYVKELEDLKKKIKDFGATFDKGGLIVDPILNMAKTMNDAATNMKAFENASASLGGVATAVMVTAKATADKIKEQTDYIKSLDVKQEKTKAELEEVKAKLRDLTQ
jgi:TP901 family phage tail tape measure protein